MAPLPGTKDAKVETPKKRKAASSAASAGTSPKSAKLQVSKATLYRDIQNLEKSQAEKRTPEEDAAAYSETCKKIRGWLDRMLEVKLKKGSKTEVADLRVKSSLEFLSLKKLNRLDKFRMKASRDATAEAKQKVDGLHLQLQNLKYELAHLQKEITKCQQFKSLHEDIDLVSVEEFYREAPEEIARSEETTSDEHQQQLARLDYEHLQRKDMNEAFKKLEESREKLEKCIRDKREKLANLKPQLASILETTQPLQEYLNMPLTEERDQMTLARHLPRPLFVLFSQARGYAEACDSGLKVSILGDLDEAKAFRTKVEENEDDDDNEDNQEDDDDDKKRGKASTKKAKVTNGQDAALLQVLEAHPLKVKLEIDLGKKKATGNMIVLEFSHVQLLKILAVRTEVVLNDAENKALEGDREVLKPLSLVAHLLGAADSGLESPNPSTLHHLTSLGIRRLDPASLNDLGFLFGWAQQLGGLDFPAASDEDEEVEVKVEVAQTSIGKTVEVIRERLRSRIALQKQVSLLAKARVQSIDPPVPEAAAHLFPAKTSCTIRNWSSVDFDQYKTLEVVKHLVESNTVESTDYLYRIQMNRAAATLIALVAVKPDYPTRAPVFCLNLHWSGEHNVHNSEKIRNLERYVNTGFDEDGLPAKFRAHILSLQLYRLMTSLDATLEAWEASSKSSGKKADFSREKLFLHPIRGRNRALPLVYDDKLQVYSQH